MNVHTKKKWTSIYMATTYEKLSNYSNSQTYELHTVKNNIPKNLQIQKNKKQSIHTNMPTIP